MIEVDYPGRGRKRSTGYRYKYDTGVSIKIYGLPDGPRHIEFEDGKQADIDADGIVNIPDRYFQTGKPVELFIVCYTEAEKETSVNTMASIEIPVRWRPAKGE